MKRLVFVNELHGLISQVRMNLDLQMATRVENLAGNVRIGIALMNDSLVRIVHYTQQTAENTGEIDKTNSLLLGISGKLDDASWARAVGG